jgi:hypothetical protein
MAYPAAADNLVVEKYGIITVTVSEDFERSDGWDECISSEIIAYIPSKKPLWFKNVENGVFFWEDEKNFYFASSFESSNLNDAQRGALAMTMYEARKNMDNFILDNIKASIPDISPNEAQRLTQQLNIFGVDGNIFVENNKSSGTIAYNISKNIYGAYQKDSFVEVVKEIFASGRTKTEYIAWALIEMSKYNYNRTTSLILDNIENQIISDDIQSTLR